jgi:hypothetical protein
VAQFSAKNDGRAPAYCTTLLHIYCTLVAHFYQIKIQNFNEFQNPIKLPPYLRQKNTPLAPKNPPLAPKKPPPLAPKKDKKLFYFTFFNLF